MCPLWSGGARRFSSKLGGFQTLAAKKLYETFGPGDNGEIFENENELITVLDSDSLLYHISSLGAGDAMMVADDRSIA